MTTKRLKWETHIRKLEGVLYKIQWARFPSIDELEKQLQDELQCDNKIKLTLEDYTDHEEEKHDYEYIFTAEYMIDGEIYYYDVTLWVLFDRQNYAIVTEYAFEDCGE